MTMSFFLFFIMAAFGFYLFWQKERQKMMFKIILFSAWLFSVLFFPLFHLRSLQIVGLGVIFLFALVIHWLYQKRQYFFVLFLCPHKFFPDR